MNPIFELGLCFVSKYHCIKNKMYYHCWSKMVEVKIQKGTDLQTLNIKLPR